jgi:succinate-acetate transporter protein
MTQQDPIATPQTKPTTLFGASIADPGPLGLAGFALTTFILSWANAGLSQGGVSAVLGVAQAYGGLAQLLAGMWEFRKGNTFGAVAFSSFGAFWISFWFLANYAPDSSGEAVWLLAWTIFTAYMTIASLRTNAVIAAVFIALTLTFLFLTIGAFASSDGMHKIGGWLGLITAVLAWYGSFAVVTNATWKRVVVPVWPLAGRA